MKMEKMRYVFLVFVSAFPLFLFSQKTLVKIKIMEDDTKKITPAMVCITNVKDTLAILPPYGDTAGAPTEVPVFMKGVEFKKDKNWVGPVRMTNGPGNNENRSSLYELKPSIPYWKAPVMYQTSGDFSIELPAGKWHISVEHGYEYIPISEDFVVAEHQPQLTKKILMKRWINLPMRGWISGDVHVHHPTNKPEFKEYLLEFGKAEDVHLINMLEMGHHLGTDFKVEGFGKKFRVCKDNVCLVSGQEDPRTEYGHIIGLNNTQQVRDTSVYTNYDYVFDRLHLQPGALVGYAHFAWNGFHKGYPWLLVNGKFDFVELLQFLRLNTLDYYDALNLGLRITAAAGSDFPWSSTIGDVRTYAYTGKKFSIDGWFDALKAGHTFISNGPVLFFDVDGKLPGTEIKKAKGSKAKLKAKAISHPGIGNIQRLAIYNNGGMLVEKFNDNKKDSIEISLDHVLTRSEWIVAVVYCDNEAVAHTTPVYLVVDGQPTWDVKKGPDVIRKQMVAMEQVETQEKAKPNADQNILKQIGKARDFYNRLLTGMNVQQ